ncbi:unnamed protein product [Nippostrongylus brasiliensis]|uniref:GDP-D-glucose phosphorylase 1 n=1 Tax=Nippostrongylus brasiliensis TaxID=27835 RepID=A0A0N4YUZ3_NIPBR|nr:unnamed protein product [Nippostrongylus brasiliensis]
MIKEPFQLPSDYKNVASSVPVYHYHTSDFIVNLRTQPADPSSSEGCSERASLKGLLHSRWEEAKSRNAFNYGLNCMYKLLEGQYNLSMQLMLYLRCEDRPITDDPLDRHVIAINASPLERDHSLIIPSVNKCLPQVISFRKDDLILFQVLTPTAIRIATDVMLLVTDDSFNILFNSLLGQASVNHLHMHCLYWPYESDLINRRFEPLNDLTNVYIIEPPNWLCSAFAFQLRTIDEYDTFRNNLTRCVQFLTDQNQAHNVFITRAQPIRTSGPVHEEDRGGAKPPTNFNPAANELAGCLTSYTIRFFESASEQAAVRIIEEEAQLQSDVFQKVGLRFAN